MPRAAAVLLALGVAACSAPRAREPEPRFAPVAVEAPVAAATPPAPRRQPALVATDVGAGGDPNPRGTTLTPRSVFVDRDPPRGWKQCAGFVNTAEDDVTADFLDNCLGSERLRVRVFGRDGTLEEDVYVLEIEPAKDWKSGNYLGGRSTLVVQTLWGGVEGGAQSAFFTQTDGTDACGQRVAPSGTTFGSGHGEKAIIAGGAAGYDEYRVSCGKQPLPGRKIALYR